MGAVDDECEVTISYNKGTGTEEGISTTRKITCVEPSAAKGTIKYERTNDVNINSHCAKFYLDGVGTDGKISVAVGEDTEIDGKPVYFSAFDDNGAAIEYDQYEVESANEAVVAAKVDGEFTSGKFTKIHLVGNEVGTTQVKVIATNNTVSKEYFMNVTVKNTEDMVKVVLKDSTNRNRALSNAYDEDYDDKITASILDDNNNEANFETIEWELLNTENYKLADNIPVWLADDPALGFGWTAAGEPADVRDQTVAVKAWGAKKATYTVKATADIADAKIAQTLKITVSELPSKAWIGNGEGVNLKYMIEVGSPSIGNLGTTNNIKLYANVNGLFAGYVRQGDITDEAGANGKGEVRINGAWKQAMIDDENAAYYQTNKMNEPAAIAGLADEQFNDKDDVYNSVELFVASGAAVGASLGHYVLTQYSYNDLGTAIFDDDQAGGYYIVEPGEATQGGEIYIGGHANGLAWVPTVQALDSATIYDGSLKWTLKFGNKSLASGELYNYLHKDPLTPVIDFYEDGIVATTSRDLIDDGFGLGGLDYLTYIAHDKTYDSEIARPGKYNIKMTYVNAKTMKTVTAENEFTVTDSVAKYTPKVTLLTKTTEDYSLDSFKEILTLNVDLNNNNGLAESLVEPGLMKKWIDDDSNGYVDPDERRQIDSNDKYAKYAVVIEEVSDTPIFFFVPVGANINED